MKINTLKRHAKEGFKNLGRNGWMTFASISAVTIMLLVVGVFLLIILNLNHLAATIEDDVEIRVYIDLTANEEQQKELGELLEQIPDVESVKYLSREEGLEQFIESMDDLGHVFESLREENPFNDVYIVRAKDPQLTEQVAKQIEGLPYIDTINYGKDVVERLFQATNFIRKFGLVLVLGLMFTAMFLISNTIKMTIVARQEEIQIMKLVGATNGFIRWPFFIEGMLLGLIGAIIPFLILFAGYSYIYKNTLNQKIGLFSIELLPVSPYIYQVGGILVLIGVFVGIWGTMMSVRKFLNI